MHSLQANVGADLGLARFLCWLCRLLLTNQDGCTKLNIEWQGDPPRPGRICLTYARQGDGVLVLHAVTLRFFTDHRKGYVERRAKY